MTAIKAVPVASFIILVLILIFSKRAVKPIAESYEKQKQFITDANHELKTPLTLILTNLDIAEAEVGKNEWLEDIRAEGERMSALVKQLVTLSRMDEDQVEMELAVFSRLTEAQLQMLNTLLNTTFTGLTLAEITPELMRVAQHAAGEAYGLISLVVSFAMEVLEGLEQRRVHTSGLAHLLELPEYQSLDRAQPLMSYLSEDSDPARFPVPKDDPMKILIGPENVADALKDTSVVVASYDIGEGMRGVIGVVGPTRMDYAKITARLSYLAEGLSRLFGQGELPQGRDDEK